MARSSSEAKSGASRQRKRQAPDELTKAITKGKGKSTKERRRILTSNAGKPSEASQQPAPKGAEKPVKELIKTKSVAGVLKILGDRVYRKMKNDEKEDKDSCIIYMSTLIKHQGMSTFKPMAQSIKTKSQWPMRSDLNDIKNNIKDMEGNLGKLDDEKKMEVLPELEKIEHDIKSLDEKRVKDSAKVDELQKLFTTEGVSLETLSEKLSTAFPKEIATDEITTTEDSAKAITLEEIFATEGLSLDTIWEKLSPTCTEFTVKDMEDFEHELFDENNCNVEFSNFLGLEDAIGVAEGNIPDYLKSIAKKIEEDHGEPTINRNILVLVSAAVKEMEDLAVDELDWPILRKWAATFNLAKGLQFEVKFVEKQLKKNMHAYFNLRLISSLKVVAA